LGSGLKGWRIGGLRSYCRSRRHGCQRRENAGVQCALLSRLKNFRRRRLEEIVDLRSRRGKMEIGAIVNGGDLVEGNKHQESYKY